ncbi:MAG: hypothetical protein QM706_00920 [Nitrospira sp.]
MFLLIIDGTASDAASILDGVNILHLADLESQLKIQLNPAYSIFERCNASKGALLKYLAPKFDRLLYIDSDCYITSPLTEVVSLLEQYNLVICPHCFSYPPNDSLRPSAEGLHLHGIYNAGVLGVASTKEGMRFISWWCDILEKSCFNKVNEGYFVDQRYLDCVPSFFDGVHVLKHWGVNVAHFNLHERQITLEDGCYYCNDKKLLLFHFTLFNLETGIFDSWVGRDYLSGAANAPLRKLMGEYGDRLQVAKKVFPYLALSPSKKDLHSRILSSNPQNFPKSESDLFCSKLT